MLLMNDAKGATIRFPGGGGGGLGLFSLARIYFSIYHEPECFFLKPYIVGQNIFFYTIQIWKHLLFETRSGYKTIAFRLSVCVCVRSPWL